MQINESVEWLFNVGSRAKRVFYVDPPLRLNKCTPLNHSKYFKDFVELEVTNGKSA